MPEQPTKAAPIPADVQQSLIDAYHYINQYKSAEAGEPKYWEGKRQRVMARCLRAFKDNGIDHFQQDPEDR